MPDDQSNKIEKLGTKEYRCSIFIDRWVDFSLQQPIIPSRKNNTHDRKGLRAAIEPIPDIDDQQGTDRDGHRCRKSLLENRCHKVSLDPLEIWLEVQEESRDADKAGIDHR